MPGSPSSALATTYFWSAGASLVVCHFTPAVNAAPPRPRRPDVFISSMIFCGSKSRAFSSPRNPPCFLKSSMDSGIDEPGAGEREARLFREERVGLGIEALLSDKFPGGFFLGTVGPRHAPVQGVHFD